jgi:tetratricopeptide (TPR) repeat protein
MQKLAPLAAFLSLIAAPALADRLILDDENIPGHGRYERCLYLVDHNPRGAYEAASTWFNDTGGTPAAHCAALALVGLGRNAEAAARLDNLGRNSAAGDLVMRSQILDQAGNAWLLAGKGDNAAASFTAALNYSINDPDILADRAQARALNKDWAGAEADLSGAIAVHANRPDLYVLRGSARHAAGKKALALADFNRALDLKPGYADALVERGAMKYESGDLAGARADWQQASSAGGEAGDAARDRLAAIPNK